MGSSDVDTLGCFGIYESNLEVYDECLAARTERTFDLDKTNARQLTSEARKNRPLPDKILHGGASRRCAD